MEFTRKCARILDSYIEPYAETPIIKGVGAREKTEEEQMEKLRFFERKKKLWPLHVLPCLKIVKKIAEKSAEFTYFSLTGIKHPGDCIPGEDHQVVPQRNLVLGRTVIRSYLASIDNEKAA